MPDFVQPAGSTISKVLLTHISLMLDLLLLLLSTEEPMPELGPICLCVILDAPVPLGSALPMCSFDLSGEVDGCIFKYLQVNCNIC